MESTLGKLIIAVIVSVILLVTITMMYQGLLGKATEDTCRASVLLRTQAVVDLGLFGKVERITPLVCNTFNEGTLRGNREQVKYQVADLMSKCWYMYAEGRVDNIFSDHDEDSNMCKICYTFRIPNNMDTGGDFYQIEGDQFAADNTYSRQPHIISASEILGFIIETDYNRGVLYGGGTQRYIGGSYQWNHYEFIFSDDARLRYSQVTRDAGSPFIQDYAGFLSQETRIKINDFAINLNTATGADFFLVTAQEFNNIDRTAARRLTEQLNLNEEDRFNSLLIMFDMKNGVVRLHAGLELERFILEEQIPNLLQMHFSNMRSIEEFNEAVSDFIEDLENRFVGEDSDLLAELGISRNSYFNYLTNRIQAPPPTIDDIYSNYTYAIAIFSTKGENINRWSNVFQTSLQWATATSGAVTLGCLSAVVTSVATPICSLGGFVIGAVGGAAAGFFVQKTANEYLYDMYNYNNSLMVMPINALSGECTIYN
ncbi:MAG: TPM domain-containing protein [Candidatus Woesearchaeota archaeon]